MATPRTLILLAALLILICAQNTTEVTLFNGTDCSTDVSRERWEVGAQDATPDGDCVRALPATTFSLEFSDLLPGCSVTIYSDVDCSFNATLALLDTCTGLPDSLRIRSFSIDGCDVPFSNSSTTTDDSNQSLSTAAKAGIGVGVTCGILIVAAVGLLVWFKRRPSKSNTSVAHPGPIEDEPKELPGEQIFELNTPRGLKMPAEKGSQELAAKRSMAELRSKSSLRIVLPQELEGDRP